MKKLIDFDGLFDEKLAEYMQKNLKKHTEKEWEEVIPKLYLKFGDTMIPALGTTPKGYYAEMSDEELIATLAAHFEKDVPVSDFLCREISARRPDGLFPLVESPNGQLAMLAVNLAEEDERAFPAYFRILETSGDEELKDAVTDRLKSAADKAKEQALALYKEGTEKERMLEVLSRCTADDRIFDILMKEFKESPDDIPMHASYLAAYGDPRALPALLEVIDEDDINYLEFQELSYAIEALGGEYTRPRDFSSDPYFLEIQSQSRLPDDLKKTE